MKTKLYILLLILPLLFLQQGCNKDYPKDIPKWLKEKIKEREKECKNYSCPCTQDGFGCWTVYEWDEEGVLYYIIHRGIVDIDDHVYVVTYDLEGNFLCESYYLRIGNGGLSYEELVKSTCPSILKVGTIKREIWKNGN